MKRHIITTIISIISILFVFSSISYAFTPAEWVNAHNKFRRLHEDTPDVKWSNTLAQSAQSWADTCIWDHCKYHPNICKNTSAGENLAGGDFSSAEAVVAYWYNDEIKKYDYNKPGYSSGTGHFTQVVWKSTTEIGCGYNSKCGHYVCQYNPPGNITGQFAANVKPTKISTVHLYYMIYHLYYKYLAPQMRIRTYPGPFSAFSAK